MLRDFAEQLRQQMLVRLAKPASEKKLKLPPVVDGDVHTSPSPLQVHPSNTDLTSGEVKDSEPDDLSDTMTPIGPTAGRPKLEDEDGKELPPIKGAGGNLRTLRLYRSLTLH